ncbi:MAG: helix-turn-helix domain-containing protein [Acidobacteriia bacterium]|nr:helix-turn-helix domain-containing protein [Terriglobia bacterium]
MPDASEVPTHLLAPTPEPSHNFAELNALGYLAEEQLIRILNLKTRRALWEMRKQKIGIPYSKIGRLIVYKTTDVQHYIERQKRETLMPRVPKSVREALHAMRQVKTPTPRKAAKR